MYYRILIKEKDKYCAYQKLSLQLLFHFCCILKKEKKMGSNQNMSDDPSNLLTFVGDWSCRNVYKY